MYIIHYKFCMRFETVQTNHLMIFVHQLFLSVLWNNHVCFYLWIDVSIRSKTFVVVFAHLYINKNSKFYSSKKSIVISFPLLNIFWRLCKSAYNVRMRLTLRYARHATGANLFILLFIWLVIYIKLQWKQCFIVILRVS